MVLMILEDTLTKMATCDNGGLIVQLRNILTEQIVLLSNTIATIYLKLMNMLEN